MSSADSSTNNVGREILIKAVIFIYISSICYYTPEIRYVGIHDDAPIGGFLILTFDTEI